MAKGRRFTGLIFCLPTLSFGLLYVACGSRTGLLVPEDFVPEDAASEHVIRRDAMPGMDADAGFDVFPEVGFDAPPEVSFRDVPAIDLCPDAGATLIYVLTQDNQLLSFYPPTLAFTPIGTLACPDMAGGTPFSMAVDRRGIAYSVFTDGSLFRVDTASGACEGTTYQSNQDGFITFGMGFVANTGDAGETLFVAEDDLANLKGNSKGLGSIDVTKYVVSFVGPFTPAIPGPELTGTSDGRLFAFYTNAVGSGSHILEVDKTTGNTIHDYPLQVGSPNDAYAFGFWGGDFWVFTGQTDTTVTQFDPTTLAETTATTFGSVVVGAGVSTCAPQ
jgi:hypothetical protein